MTHRVRLTMGVAGASATIVAGRWVWDRLSRWRRKDPEELERLRRLEVNRVGRVTAGQVLDLLEPEPPNRAARLVVYKYEVAGVTYEAAQEVTSLPDLVPSARTLAGQTASVKYDPKKPTNSIIVCEEWSGIELGTGN